MQIQKYEDRAKHNISKSTLRPRISALKDFEDFLDGGEPTPEDFENWCDDLIKRYEDGQIGSGTVRQYAKAGKYYFQVVKGGSDEIEHVFNYLPTANSDAGDYLDEKEWEYFLDSITNYKYKALFEIMYHYARRPTEIILLNKEDVDFDENTITFNILKKSDKSLPMLEVGDEEYRVLRATYELEEDVKDILQKYLRFRDEQEEVVVYDEEEKVVEPLFTTPQGRISYDSVYKKTKQTVEGMGIGKNITPKSLRHSRATHLDWGGNSPGNIARDMLVHSPNSRVIGRYVHDREEDQVREVMDKQTDEEEDA